MQHHDFIQSEGHNGRPTVQHVPSVETTPLLGQVESHTLTVRSLYYKELKDLVFNSCTVTGGYLLQQSLQISSIFIVGRLGPLELSVAAFSYMIASTTGWLLAIGGTTAIDSLGSASIGRGDHVGEIGVLLQKYLISVTMMFIPVALLWTYSAAILLGFHVQPDIAYDIRAPGSFILLITAIINVPLNYLLVHVFKWGLIGGAIATGSMYWLSALLTVAYIYFVDGSAGWQGWSRASLQDLGQFSRTVFFGIVSIGAEWWAFETISIAAGTMGNIEAAVQSVIMTTDTVMALFPFGLGIATTNRVATLLGAGQLQRAKTVSRIASALAALNGCIVTIILLVFPTQITKFYTVDPDVLKVARVVFPWAAAFQVSDGLQCVNGGTLRALDRAGFAALINLVSYYALALPLCLTLAFIADLGLSGLWAGLALALTLCGGVEFLIVNVMDWKRLGFGEVKTEVDDD
ncbi:hypothetical protein ZTR_03654 [Talaromyces verruculosus]|nr:hypothetical protein ZTR_03654 [Talaromyces verruculosus]